MKIYYIYKITNLVNNKIYVGVHITSQLDDGYMGSGKVIKRAIEKYGIENFEKDILEFFDSEDAMYAREKEVVTDEFLLREDVYNLRRGGSGGFDYINKKRLNLGGCFGREDVRKLAFDSRMKRTYDTGLTERELQRNREATKKRDKMYASGEIICHFKELNKCEEFQKKRKEAYKSINHQQGEKNSQYGTCWIYHELVGNKKIKKELLPHYIDQGWYKGRMSSIVPAPLA